MVACYECHWAYFPIESNSDAKCIPVNDKVDISHIEKVVNEAATVAMYCDIVLFHDKSLDNKHCSLLSDRVNALSSIFALTCVWLQSALPGEGAYLST